MVKSDVIVLGGGPGGYLAAQRAAENGKTVTLIEERNLGGVCLNEGCIPSKTFLNSAKLYDYARSSEAYGVTTAEAKLDHQKVVARKNNVVKTLVGGIDAKLKSCGVTIISGKGVLKEKTSEGILVSVENDSNPESKPYSREIGLSTEGEHHSGMNEPAAKGELYLGEKAIIATGSAPIMPNIPGLREGVASGFVITNREIFELAEIPSHLTIIGGGVIGLEMASYFASAGSKVTVIEMMDRIAPAFDRDITNTLLKELKKKGITFLLSSQVTAISNKSVFYKNTKTISVKEPEEVSANKLHHHTDKDADETFEIQTDYVLCSIGRNPVIESIGLENLNIYTNKGAIVTDDHMNTNVSGVYAVGDVNAKYMLAHTAYREAEVAVNHLLGKNDKMRYDAVPSIIYTYPEVACVGMTEEQAKGEGLEVKSITLSFKYSGRYLAEVDKGNGFCKIIVDTKRDCIVGVHMIGSYVSEMIYGVTHMIEARTPLDHIKETIFPHPTVCEVIREALYDT